MRKSLTLATLPLWMVLGANAAFAQTEQVEEQDDYLHEDIIVTATMRVTAGGAQDINHFRQMAIEEGEMPRPESLTVEGLLGQHDLLLPLSRNCGQLLCLATESMTRPMPLRADDRLFVGLGFASNVAADGWRREPLNLVAVVDQSGSMSGEPLELVRQGLAHVARQMTDRDRMSIILYGSDAHVWMAPTSIAGNREAVLARIAAIPSEGSTDMESGLKLGFATAAKDAPGFKGNTRVMLFTDEQPNVGATDAGSFMGMATAAADKGIGMTTIGVGVQYDGALATRIGSVKGGNLFFVEDQERVAKLFREELNTMVSEIARDIRIAMTPAKGYSISGVFGVPDGIMEQGRDGSVEITVPTAFFSTEAGGIFVTLGKEGKRANLPALALDSGQPLMTVRLSYTGVSDGKRAHDELAVAGPTAAPSANLVKAHALVDQFLVMREASLAYHRDGKPKEAHRLLSALSSRLSAIPGEDMEQEMQLVSAMVDKSAKMSGYAGEVSAQLRGMALDGDWEVRRVEGLSDMARGDRLRFSAEDKAMTIQRRKPPRGREEEEREAFAFDGQRLSLPESKLELAYKSFGDRVRLRMRDIEGPVQIDLARAVD